MGIPVFGALADCAPWVLGDLWPAQLADVTAETADYLNSDLRRIADSANMKLAAISRAGLVGPARQAAENSVISAARAFATRRIDSTLRQLRDGPAQSPPEYIGSHWAKLAAETFPEPLTDKPAEPDGTVEPSSDEQRLRQLVDFVAGQEPRLHWAVGTRRDGSTMLVTDLAYGWIPAGIQLPAGVRLLEPGRHAGNAATLLGDATRIETYAPGDRLGWPTEFAPRKPSDQPRKLPIIDDLGEMLAVAVRRRGGLPLLVSTLAEAAAAGTKAVDAELDLLRVYGDTARYQLLAQYPDVDTAVLLDCLLLAATAGLAAGDEVSANYHLTWFQVLSGRSAGAAALDETQMN